MLRGRSVRLDKRSEDSSLGPKNKGEWGLRYGNT